MSILPCTCCRLVHKDDGWVGDQLDSNGQALALLHRQPRAPGQSDQRVCEGAQLHQMLNLACVAGLASSLGHQGVLQKLCDNSTRQSRMRKEIYLLHKGACDIGAGIGQAQPCREKERLVHGDLEAFLAWSTIRLSKLLPNGVNLAN